MVIIGHRNSGRHHVRIPDGLHLVDVIILKPVVEEIVERVEKIDDLVGRALSGQVGEAHDVTQENGDAFEALRLRGLTLLHLTDDLPGQEVRQELFRLPFLFPVDIHALVVDVGKPEINTYSTHSKFNGLGSHT